MTTASESCDTTSQMSLFGETCDDLAMPKLPPYLPTPNANEHIAERYTLETSYRHATQGRQVHLAQVVRDGRLTSSPQAIPASHSHSPGSDWARKMTATYGRKLSAYWLSCDPPDSWVRTLLGTSTWASTTCYLTWKKSVTPAGRLLFRLVPSTPRIAGIGSGSLLHTPTVTANQSSPSMVDRDKGSWRLWPTPRLEFDSGRHRGQPDTLHSAVKLWGTPTSRDHKDVGDMTNVPENGLLGQQVLNDARAFPTPQARDWKGAQGRAYKGESMDLPATVLVAGLKLNSAWVSRMMGYPDNWLDLTPDGEAIP